MKSPLWFKRKRYGWGWVPVTWQGWLVLATYIVLVLACGRVLHEHFELIILFTIVLLCICYKKGEKPRWQWGGKVQKNKST